MTPSRWDVCPQSRRHRERRVLCHVRTVTRRLLQVSAGVGWGDLGSEPVGTLILDSSLQNCERQMPLVGRPACGGCYSSLSWRGHRIWHDVSLSLPFQASGDLMPAPPCPCSSTLPLTHTGPCQLPLSALNTAGGLASAVSPPGPLHPPCPG